MMADDLAVVVQGLRTLQDIENLPKSILRAARQAVNKTIDYGRAESARQVRKQVDFPARYLSGQNGRLAITKRAQGADLEGIISASDTEAIDTFARYGFTITPSTTTKNEILNKPDSGISFGGRQPAGGNKTR